MPPAGKRKANAMLDRIEKMAKQSEFDEERKKVTNMKWREKNTLKVQEPCLRNLRKRRRKSNTLTGC